jgi:hypothetical protein
MYQNTLPSNHLSVTPGKTVVKIGSRDVAEAVTQYTLEKAARGPSNLTGGSLITGSPGLTGA